MRVYRGKLNWSNFAVNETCSFVLPGTFDVGQPVYAIWQWTKDSEGNSKPNVFLQGHVNTDTVSEGARIVGFHYENYYKFDAVVGSDDGLTVTMRNPNGDKSKAIALKLTYNDSGSSKFLIYTGKYNEVPYANDEMMTVIMSPTLSFGSTIGIFWQWTSDWGHTKKVMQSYVGTVTSYQQNASQIKLEFISAEAYYKILILNWRIATDDLEMGARVLVIIAVFEREQR
jgi:hypothetical protein